MEETLFKTYSLGVVTARDAWAYNFDSNTLTENLTRMMKHYNGQVFQWEQRHTEKFTVNDFIDTDDTKIKWTRSLKSNLKTGKLAEFSAENVRTSLYRPFTKSHLYFDRMMNECVYVFPSIFPTPETEEENRVICVSGLGHDIFRCHITNRIPDYKFSNSSNGGTQCFPFYTYNGDGTNRRENITDWALKSSNALPRRHHNQVGISFTIPTDFCIIPIIEKSIRRTSSETYRISQPPSPPLTGGCSGLLGSCESRARLADLHVKLRVTTRIR